MVCENFRPGTSDKRGLGYEVMRVINPRLVMLRISGFGHDGPNRDRPGFARIAHAFGGLAHLTGEADGPPLPPGLNRARRLTSWGSMARLAFCSH